MTTIGETETITKLSARLEKKYSYLRRAWRHSKQNWCPHDVCQGCLKTLWHSGHKSFLSSRFRNFILAFDIDRIFWYLPYSLILRIAFCIGRYYDEEVHLQRDCKQSGNGKCRWKQLYVFRRKFGNGWNGEWWVELLFKQPWQTSCGHQFCFECLQALLRYEYFFSRRADCQWSWVPKLKLSCLLFYWFKILYHFSVTYILFR